MTEVLAVPLAEAETELDLRTILGLLSEPRVGGVDELAPATGGLGHALEVAHGLVVPVVLGEGVDQRVECLILVFQLLLEDPRDTPEEVAFLRRGLARLEPVQIELDQLFPPSGDGVQLLELLEGHLMGRLDLEDLLVGRCGPVVLLHVAPDLGHFQELADLLLWLGKRLGALHLHVDDVGPPLLRAVARFELVHRLEVGRIDLEEAPPRLGCLVGCAEDVAVRPPELAVDFT